VCTTSFQIKILANRHLAECNAIIILFKTDQNVFSSLAGQIFIRRRRRSDGRSRRNGESTDFVVDIDTSAASSPPTLHSNVVRVATRKATPEIEEDHQLRVLLLRRSFYRSVSFGSFTGYAVI
jgi:hypothetical protein